jgi:hypothetical protein
MLTQKVAITVTVRSVYTESDGYVFETDRGEIFLVSSHKEVVQAEEFFHRKKPLHIHRSHHTPFKKVASTAFAKRPRPKRFLCVNREAEMFKAGDDSTDVFRRTGNVISVHCYSLIAETGTDREKDQ